MRTLIHLLYKDLLVIVRDRAGLAMLFLMPVALVLIMTAMQDNTFRAINESGIRLVLLNQDSDSLGTAIEKEIAGSQMFSIQHEIDGHRPTPKEVRDAVAAGKFQIGLVIPENATRQIRERVQKNVERVFSGDTLAPATAEPVIIQLYADPATRNSLRSSLQESIGAYSARIESRIIFNELALEINRRMMIPVSSMNRMTNQVVFYKEEYVARNDRTTIPNSTQHNVPAYTLFAMFFIVIPFAGAMIREREDGSLARLMTMPCRMSTLLFSKVLIYLLVCYLQFVTIILMGIYLFPLLGLPQLMLNGRFAVLSLLALTAALAAIGYGIAVGTLSRTHQQAAIFASISVVILAAIGGIWVPVFIMPPFLRHLSSLSPLNWGLNGFYDIFLRNAGFREVIPNGTALLLFAAGCMLLALYAQHIRRDKV
jgi:ABC-2 type transport system permease protein